MCHILLHIIHILFLECGITCEIFKINTPYAYGMYNMYTMVLLYIVKTTVFHVPQFYTLLAIFRCSKLTAKESSIRNAFPSSWGMSSGCSRSISSAPRISQQSQKLFRPINCIQWNPSNTDTLGTKIIVLISKVSLFQGENNMYLYKVGTWPGVPIKQGVLISEVSLKKGSTI